MSKNPTQGLLGKVNSLLQYLRRREDATASPPPRGPERKAVHDLGIMRKTGRGSTQRVEKVAKKKNKRSGRPHRGGKEGDTKEPRNTGEKGSSSPPSSKNHTSSRRWGAGTLERRVSSEGRKGRESFRISSLRNDCWAIIRKRIRNST